MAKQFLIRVDSCDLGQLLDGLRARSESWQKTAEYMKSGFISEGYFLCEECTDASEAAAIARHFSKIVSLIERQVKQQGGWS